MRTFFLLASVLLSSLSMVKAQQKIEVEQIWNGTFRTNQLNALNTLHTKNQYSVLDFNRNSNSFTIDAFDFTTLEKVQTLFSTADHPEIQQVSDYQINKTDDKILIATDYHPIYRHSFTSVYYLYDIPSNTLTKISDNTIQEPLLNVNDSKVAYAFENNLYVFDVASQKTIQITKDGKKNAVINGITDWVYEEEFAFVRAFDWNADGTKLAYISFDESEVPVFSMDVYGDELYPQQQVFKYPKAGENNAKVSLHLYDVVKSTTKNVALNAEKDYYIPRIKFTNDKNLLSVQTLNRHQNQLNVLFVDTNTGKTSTILTEKDNAYVDVTDNLTFLDDNSFIWTSEKDGFNHIYHYNNDGSLNNKVTSGNWEVTNYYGYNPENETIYYQSVENGSTKRDVFSIQLNGTDKKQLSSLNGTNNAIFSPDYKHFINNHSSSTKAPSYTLVETSSGKKLKEILNNNDLEAKLKNTTCLRKNLLRLKTKLETI